MLKKILSPRTCANCRVCCGFDNGDIWETPILTEELVEYIKENINPKQKFLKMGNSYLFDMSFADGEELVFCPMLSETGCILGDKKPFDCKVWPYRVMRVGDKLAITISPVCEPLFSEPLEKLSSFACKEIADTMFAEAEKNPDIIKDYIADYPILKIK